MRPAAACLIGAVLGIAHPGETRGQTFADVFSQPPEHRAAEAFRTRHGRMLVAETGRILAASADAECLRSRNLSPQALANGARSLLVRNGAHLLGIYAQLTDRKKLEEALRANPGPDARAEAEDLSREPELRKLIVLTELARLATLALHVVELTDRHVMLSGIALTARLGPQPGNATLMNADPTARALEARTTMIVSSRSPRLIRWLEIEEASDAAFAQALDRSALARYGPRELTPDTVTALADLCVFPRPAS